MDFRRYTYIISLIILKWIVCNGFFTGIYTFSMKYHCRKNIIFCFVPPFFSSLVCLREWLRGWNTIHTLRERRKMLCVHECILDAVSVFAARCFWCACEWHTKIRIYFIEVLELETIFWYELAEWLFFWMHVDYVRLKTSLFIGGKFKNSNCLKF